MKEDILEFVARYFRPGALDISRAWRRISTGRRSIWPSVYAAAFALAAIVAGVFIFTHGKTEWTDIPSAATSQTVVLPDGSRCVIAPGAALSFHKKHFAHNDRDVHMKGKVYFEVERDAKLPFRILASDAVVSVLGTRFQVLHSPDSTCVDVVSGTVSLSASAYPESGVILGEDMHASLAAGASSPQISKSGSINPAAWANHLFTYNGTPLDVVLQDLSDCFGHSLSCDATDRNLTGSFRAESVSEAVSIIEETIDVKITIQ